MIFLIPKFFFLSDFIEVWLTYKNLYIFNVYNFISKVLVMLIQLQPLELMLFRWEGIVFNLKCVQNNSKS